MSACSAFRREFINFGGEKNVDVGLVSIEPRPLPDMGRAMSAEAIERQLEANHRVLQILVVALGAGEF